MLARAGLGTQNRLDVIVSTSDSGELVTGWLGAFTECCIGAWGEHGAHHPMSSHVMTGWPFRTRVQHSVARYARDFNILPDAGARARASTGVEPGRDTRTRLALSHQKVLWSKV